MPYGKKEIDEFDNKLAEFKPEESHADESLDDNLAKKDALASLSQHIGADDGDDSDDLEVDPGDDLVGNMAATEKKKSKKKSGGGMGGMAGGMMGGGGMGGMMG